MKYLVMECHAGYAVLMDEASRFVRAANLHYEVGQTVTEPVLMEEAKPSIRRSTVLRIAAAAACLVLLSGIGLKVYLNKGKACSSVRLCSELEFEMQLNSVGEVIRISSSTESGQAMLDSVSVKKKDVAEVVGELLSMQCEQGYIAEGETVSVYIDSDDDKKYEEYKSGVETEAEKLHLQVSVQPPQPPHERDKDASLSGPAGIGSEVKPGGPVKPGEPPQEALRTDHDKPEPPQPPDATKPEKGSGPAGPGTAAKTETGTRIRHPEPPAEHGTEPADLPDQTEPQITAETQPADPPVPPEVLDQRGLPHAEPPHAELIGPPESPSDDDRTDDAEAPAPDDIPEPPDAPVPGEMPEVIHTEPAEPPEPVMTDTECEPVMPELQQETVPRPEPHPPVPQAAERPHI